MDAPRAEAPLLIAFADLTHFQVNAACMPARMPSKGLALSAEAFRALRPETRKAFKKHTPPVVYIPLDDPRP